MFFWFIIDATLPAPFNKVLKPFHYCERLDKHHTIHEALDYVYETIDAWPKGAGETVFRLYTAPADFDGSMLAQYQMCIYKKVLN